MSVCFIPPCTPLLHSKTGVYRGMHYFLIFALKHMQWVLKCTHNIYFLSKNIKIVKKKATENCHFYGGEKSLYIAWVCFCNEKEGGPNRSVSNSKFSSVRQ